MTKAEIIAQIAKKTGIDRKTVSVTLESFMVEVKNSLAGNENVYLRGFGSFVAKERAERKGQNISKNITVIIPARRIVVFKPSNDFNITL